MTADQYAPAVLQAGRDLGITERGIVIGFATVFVESNWTMYANAKVPDSMNIPHEAVGSDGYSVGLFQQQVVLGSGGWWWGDAATCMDPYKSAQLFFTRLARLDYNGPNSPGSYAQAVQQSAFPDRYDERMGDAQALYDQITSGQPTGGTVPTPTDPRLAALQAVRPDFNELEFWCDNNQDRAGTAVDLFLIHTQEPGDLDDDDAALHLAQFLMSTEGGSNPVSYHYTGRQARDGGVTVYDIVDTDLASWSVGNSNNRAINFCFAGSGVAWSRDDWMTQAKAIDVAAYLAVQDCIKYGIDPKVIPGPAYPSDPPGISDHRYCTEHLRDGNDHNDVGDNFPWDVFAASVAKYWAAANNAAPPPADNGGDAPPAPADGDLRGLPLEDKVNEVLAQTRGRWGRLGKNAAGQDRTPIEAMGAILDHLEGTDNSQNGAFSW